VGFQNLKKDPLMKRFVKKGRKVMDRKLYDFFGMLPLDFLGSSGSMEERLNDIFMPECLFEFEQRKNYLSGKDPKLSFQLTNLVRKPSLDVGFCTIIGR